MQTGKFSNISGFYDNLLCFIRNMQNVRSKVDKLNFMLAILKITKSAIASLKIGNCF